MKIQSFKFRIFVALFMVLFFSSCENDATVEPPPFVKKPVFTSLISPQSDSIQVMAFYTQPYWGKVTYDFDPIVGATITITDLNTSKTITLSYINNGNYSIAASELPIVNGHTYVMEAKVPKELTVFKARTTVPPAPAVSKLLLISQIVSEPNQNSGGIFQGSETNLLTLKLDYVGNLGTGNFVAPNLNATFENDNAEQLQVPVNFDSDFNFLEGNADNKVEYFGQQEFYSGWGTAGPWKLIQLDGSIYTTDKAFKLFNISQFYSSSGGGGDLFSEPQPVIGNFSEGALGVFASYDYTTGIVYKK